MKKSLIKLDITLDLSAIVLCLLLHVWNIVNIVWTLMIGTIRSYMICVVSIAVGIGLLKTLIFLVKDLIANRKELKELIK